MTLRHFPQSFEFSTLGGWIATRSGGHYATLHTHIDDFVESIRAVTPPGVWESRRLPGSGAGPCPDRMLLGSEGTLGVITEAWMRLQDRPDVPRVGRGRRFDDFAAGGGGRPRDRAVGPATRRTAACSTPTEARSPAPATAGTALLVLGFESADHPARRVDGARARVRADHGGERRASVATGAGRPTATRGAAGRGATRSSRAPYLRDALVAIGVISETFETAFTWDRFAAFHARSRGAAGVAAAEARGAGPARDVCRFTHVYPDGPAPYFTVLAPARRGERARAVGRDQGRGLRGASIAAGGTITHHHAVGRDHRPWYDRQRPEPFAAALRAAKRRARPRRDPQPGRPDRPLPSLSAREAGKRQQGELRRAPAVRSVARASDAEVDDQVLPAPVGEQLVEAGYPLRALVAGARVANAADGPGKMFGVVAENWAVSTIRLSQRWRASRARSRATPTLTPSAV